MAATVFGACRSSSATLSAPRQSVAVPVVPHWPLVKSLK